jgi:hypothetical protein
VLTAESEASAAALYWSVMQQNQPMLSPDATIAVLKQTIALNPYVAEPYLVLAQLYMTFRNFEEGERYAAAGVQLVSGFDSSRIAAEHSVHDRHRPLPRFRCDGDHDGLAACHAH